MAIVPMALPPGGPGVPDAASPILARHTDSPGHQTAGAQIGPG